MDLAKVHRSMSRSINVRFIKCVSAELLTTRISIERLTIIQQRNVNTFNVNYNILHCMSISQNHLSDTRVQQILYKKIFYMTYCLVYRLIRIIRNVSWVLHLSWILVHFLSCKIYASNICRRLIVPWLESNINGQMKILLDYVECKSVPLAFSYVLCD